MTDLKLCPFCGGKAVTVNLGNGNEVVGCGKLYCAGRYNGVSAEAWNERPLDEAVDEKYKRMLDALRRVKDDWKNGDYTEETHKAVCEALS